MQALKEFIEPWINLLSRAPAGSLSNDSNLAVSERIMEIMEQPWERLKAVARDSIRQMEMTRFYLQQKKDPHGTSIALFVGNLPPNLSQRQYETILTDILGRGLYFISFKNLYLSGTLIFFSLCFQCHRMDWCHSQSVVLT